MGKYNYIGIRFNPDSANSIKEKLFELNLLQKEDSTDKYSKFYLTLREKHLQDFRDDLDEIVSQAISDSS